MRTMRCFGACFYCANFNQGKSYLDDYNIKILPSNITF